MRLLVTGGTGFIGRALVGELRARYPEAKVIPVGSATVDLADERAWFDWLGDVRAGGPVDHLIHLAALYKITSPVYAVVHIDHAPFSV